MNHFTMSGCKWERTGIFWLGWYLEIATKISALFITTIACASIVESFCRDLICYLGEAADIIKFGNSSKRAADSNLIGQYGNGLKS